MRRYQLPPHYSEGSTETVSAHMTFPVPAKQTTCPCIGGSSRDILFVTTASNFFNESRYTDEPLAGSVFMFQLPSAEYYKDENLFDDSLSLETCPITVNK